jgi:hypothetical protein
MTIWKRVKHLWTLLTTAEVFDDRGSLGRRTTVRRAPRGSREQATTGRPGSFGIPASSVSARISAQGAR